MENFRRVAGLVQMCPEYVLDYLRGVEDADNCFGHTRRDGDGDQLALGSEDAAGALRIDAEWSHDVLFSSYSRAAASTVRKASRWLMR